MKKTNDDYILQLVRVHKGNIINIEDYMGAHTKILHQCNICDNIWNSMPAKVGNEGTGCPKCALINSRNKQLKTQEQFIQDLYIKSPNITSLDLYRGAHNYIRFKCNSCDHTWNSTPHGVKGCPGTVCVNKNRIGFYSVNNVPETLLVYLLKISYNKEYFLKVGLTQNISKRLYSIKADLPTNSKIEVIHSVTTKGIIALSIENLIINTFDRYLPEVSFGGHTECISIYSNVDLIKEIMDENIH